RSATSTFVPARASRIAAARPLPTPSPAAPPPEISATLPARPSSSSGPFMAFLPLLWADDSNAGEGREGRKAHGNVGFRHCELSNPFIGSWRYGLLRRF